MKTFFRTANGVLTILENLKPKLLRMLSQIFGDADRHDEVRNVLFFNFPLGYCYQCLCIQNLLEPFVKKFIIFIR